MAKGKEQYEARLAALNLLGKDLARRAKSNCELCEAGGLTLEIFEVPPEPKEPDIDRCVMICETCAEAFKRPERFEPSEQWRFLAQTVWSEIPAVQVLAVRLLRRQADSQAWAREALDSAFLDEEVDAWVTEAS